MNEFFLDKNSKFSITGSPSQSFPRWMDIIHCIDQRHSLILVSGEKLVFQSDCNITLGTTLYLRYSAALETISPDGLLISIGLRVSNDSTLVEKKLFDLEIDGDKQPALWREISFNLDYLSGHHGQITISCGPGSLGDGNADWVAISELCIADYEKIPLLKARSLYEMRVKNETTHFSEVYRQDFYGGGLVNFRNDKSPPKIKHINGFKSSQEKVIPTSLIDGLDVLSGEGVYEYSKRLLVNSLASPQVNFQERMDFLLKKKSSLRVLSLCSGSARTEIALAKLFGHRVSWTLLDFNVDLLRLAYSGFPSDSEVELVEANVNQLEASDERWDIIICVSALHHVVELEKVIKFCYESIVDDGELWIIGEYVGMNGSKLGFEARKKANEIFKLLPEKYRFNKYSKIHDYEIPNNDFSVGCFEGIRSQEIEGVLSRLFESTQYYKINCFLWRIIDQAYLNNFDIDSAIDRAWLQKIIIAELSAYGEGIQGSELFGIYKKKTFLRQHQCSSNGVKSDGFNINHNDQLPHYNLNAAEDNIFKDHDYREGLCNICGNYSKFFFNDISMARESLVCKYCRSTSRYRSIARGVLEALDSNQKIKATSLNDLCEKANQYPLRIYDTQTAFYWEQCSYSIPDYLKKLENCEVFTSTFKSNLNLGVEISNGITNQNLEALTFPDNYFDIVITSDVMEHVRLDDIAHREILRVLKPGGFYIFTVPHVRKWENTLTRVQVVDPLDPSCDLNLLEPEYHGDTNGDGSGVLSYRVYGRELDLFLENIGFEVFYTKKDYQDNAIINTELFYCKKL